MALREDTFCLMLMHDDDRKQNGIAIAIDKYFSHK